MNILLLFLLIYIIILITNQYNEHFYDIEYGPFNRIPLQIGLNREYLFNPYYNYNYTNFPFWNVPLGTTRNMSYDLRGDPIIIPRTNFVWNNSSIYPIYNR